MFPNGYVLACYLHGSLSAREYLTLEHHSVAPREEHLCVFHSEPHYPSVPSEANRHPPSAQVWVLTDLSGDYWYTENPPLPVQSLLQAFATKANWPPHSGICLQTGSSFLGPACPARFATEKHYSGIGPKHSSYFKNLCEHTFESGL